MNLAPNLEIFFTDRPYPERIARIADMGFRAADLFGPDNKNPGEIGRTCEKHNVTISMLVGSDLKKAFNDRSLHDDLVKRVEKTAQAAREMHACNIVVLSGNALPKVPASAQNQAIIDGLKMLVPIAEKYEVTILMEMLNSLYDHPGYYLDSTELMVNLVRAVNHPRVKGLYDIYHAGIMGGNIIEDISSGMVALGADAIIPVEQSRTLAHKMRDNKKFCYREIPGGNHDSPIYDTEGSNRILQFV